MHKDDNVQSQKQNEIQQCINIGPISREMML